MAREASRLDGTQLVTEPNGSQGVVSVLGPGVWDGLGWRINIPASSQAFQSVVADTTFQGSATASNHASLRCLVSIQTSRP